MENPKPVVQEQPLSRQGDDSRIYWLFWVAVGGAALIALVVPRVMPVPETKLQEGILLALLPVMCFVAYKLW